MTRVEQYGATGGTYDYQSNEVHSYDENGNRTNTGYSTGTNNRLLSDGVYDYLYDAEGNRTKKTEIATGDATEYQWDHRNRLVKVTHLDSGGTPTQTLDFKYDIFDRRIGRSDTPAVGPAYLEDYVYDGEHLALEFEAGALANRYLHGPVIDQLLADEQVSSLSSPGDVLWPLTDNLGTVRDLASYDAGTDTTTTANHITYDAFGGIMAETNAAVDHLFAYTGREWDAEADLQYNRARWYDPGVGRWLSLDPIGFDARDGSLYRYAKNRPTMATDPSDLWAWDDDWIELGFGGLLGLQGHEIQAAAGRSDRRSPRSTTQTRRSAGKTGPRGMIAMTLTNDGQRLKAFIESYGTKCGAGVHEERISAFERHHNISMPKDLRAYFLEMNGTSGDYTYGIIRFWSIDEVRSVAEEISSARPEMLIIQTAYKEPIEDGDNFFVFADCMYDIQLYAIHLSSRDKDTSVILLNGSEPIKVAGSFSEFVELYLTSSERLRLMD